MTEPKDFTPEKNKLASGRYAVAIQLAFGALIIAGFSAWRGQAEIQVQYLQFAKEILGFYLGMKVGEIVAKSQQGGTK